MRRVVVLLVAAVLVNLPWVHEAWTDHLIDSRGEQVQAVVLHARSVSGRTFVDYRLPRSLDADGTTYSARVDDAAYRTAKQTHRLHVTAVPGKPAANRPAGEVANSFFGVVAAIGDLVLLLIAGALWWRSRRWRPVQVAGVEDGLVHLRLGPMELTVTTPAGWADSVAPGQRVRGHLDLVAETDLAPGVPVGVLDRLADARYLARGRVVDVKRGAVKLELDNGYVLSVDVGPHRNRADYRDHAELTGILRFTPGR